MANRKDAVVNLVEEKLPVFTDVSDKVWDFAELMFQEHKSSALEAEVMKQQGFTVEYGVAGMDTAMVASYGSGHPVVAILGEYDALPALSQKPDCMTKDPIEDGKPGHGCGHHLLGAASMSACTAVKDYLQANNLPGTIRYYGCPAEEGGAGKAIMIRAGLFKDVDIVLTWHPAQFNYAWDGSDCLAIMMSKYSFKGISSHAAASPQHGRSALDALELMNVGIQFLREHVISDARIHYAITNTGGTAPGVVQSEAAGVYTVRAPQVSDMLAISERVDKIAEGAALMTETTMEKQLIVGMSNLRATKAVYDRYVANLNSLLPVDFTDEELEYAEKFKKTYPDSDIPRMLRSLKRAYPDKSAEELRAMLDMPMPNYYCREYENSASTDAGDVTWVVPGCQLHVACYPAGTPYHSWQMTTMGKSSLAHKGMATAAKTLAMTALDFITDEELTKKAWADFKEMMGDETYTCLLPPVEE